MNGCHPASFGAWNDDCLGPAALGLLFWLTLAGLVAIAALALWHYLRHTGRGAAARGHGRSRRRRILLSLAMAFGLAGTGTRTAAAAPARPRAPSGTEPAPKGKVLTNVRLHNTAATAQEVGFVTPMFGQAFGQGKMPAGSYPQFTLENGTPCPATLWGITSWPDGSMKFCAAMLHIPTGIAPRDALSVQVRTGGSRPPASGMGVDELRTADVRVELEGLDGLDGLWTATLRDGIRDGADLVQLADGAAGAVWRIGSDFRNTRGEAHGQLYCWHYVAALQDTQGRLLGLRYLGRVAQPWTDVIAPVPRHRDLKAWLRLGTTLLRVLHGHVDSETAGETIRLPHYASFFTAGETAQWDELQADGKALRESTVRITVDPAYLIATRLAPPYHLQVQIRPAANLAYNPMGPGTIMRAMGTTGERDDIGVWPEWNVRHLLTQDISHERVARVNAMASAGWRLAMRKRATRQPVPCVQLRPRYAGLGQAETGWRGYTHMHGMAVPKPNLSLWREDMAHRPGCVYWPYLFTGEPQYLDLLVEHAFAHVLERPQGTNTYATQTPITALYVDGWKGGRNLRIGADGPTFPGAGVLFNGESGVRSAAWGSRDTAQAAAMCPDIAPDGAGVREYLRDVMDSAYAALAEYEQRMPASFSRAGLFVMHRNNGNPWMHAYLSWSICHQADVLATPPAVRAREYMSRMWRAYAEVADIGGMTAYRISYWTESRMVERVEDVVSLRRGPIHFSSATSRGTIVRERNSPELIWKPTDGDVFVFGAPETSPELPSSDIVPSQRLYAVHCDGHSFQLARMPGGPPIRIPRDLDTSLYMCRVRNLGPALRYSGNPYNYQANLRGAVAYHLLRGDDVRAAKQALDKIVDGQQIKFDNRAKYLVTAD